MSSDSDDSRLRDEHGRYVSEVTPEDVLDVFESVPGPTITTSDVVEELDCSREVARNRLTELAERGLVERRKSGRVVLWWRGDDAASNPYLSGDGALADTDVPEQMRDERERAREEWEEHGNAVSR
jgi:DNA-binding IclR family transcriptional regulator